MVLNFWNRGESLLSACSIMLPYTVYVMIVHQAQLTAWRQRHQNLEAIHDGSNCTFPWILGFSCPLKYFLGDGTLNNYLQRKATSRARPLNIFSFELVAAPVSKQTFFFEPTINTSRPKAVPKHLLSQDFWTFPFAPLFFVRRHHTFQWSKKCCPMRTLYQAETTMYWSGQMNLQNCRKKRGDCQNILAKGHERKPWWHISNQFQRKEVLQFGKEMERCKKVWENLKENLAKLEDHCRKQGIQQGQPTIPTLPPIVAMVASPEKSSVSICLCKGQG